MTRIRITYIGRVISTKDKIIHKYLKEDGDSLLFKSKLSTELPGQIIECTETETGVKSPYKIVGSVEPDKVTKYIESDKLTYTDWQLSKDLKGNHKSEYDYLIKRLGIIHDSLPYNQRKLFRIRVMIDIS